VLDMATGSGCIGLALAHAWPQALVTLVDVSEDALELARMNTARLKFDERVRTLRSDLFDKVSSEFDLIVSNLPYIPTSDLAALSREVQCDPKLALDGGADGLDLVRRFLSDAPARLAEHGVIALEVGHDQGDATAALATDAGFVQPQVLADLQGVRRFVMAVRGERPATTEAETSAP
jgi:release factor glutamine methyltransferase